MVDIEFKFKPGERVIYRNIIGVKREAVVRECTYTGNTNFYRLEIDCGDANIDRMKVCTSEDDIIRKI